MTAPDLPKVWSLAQPCPACDSITGTVTQVGPNIVERCRCGRGTGRCIPKSEFGLATRSTRRNFANRHEAVILLLDGRACILCGAGPPDVALHVGHLVARHHAITVLKWSPAEADNPANTAAMCEPHNLGLGSFPVGPETIRDVAWRRAARARDVPDAWRWYVAHVDGFDPAARLENAS